MTEQNLSSVTHQTYDFSTMYPSMDLGCVKKKLTDYVALVFEHAKQTAYPLNEPKVLVLRRRGVNKRPWRTACTLQACQCKNTLCKQTVTQKRLVQWIEYLVDNLHVRVGDRLMRQRIGVPMGTACSPWLANLTLFMYELEYFSFQISQLIPSEINSKSPKWQRLRNLSFCTRYIDDLWNPLVSKDNFQETARQIYPRESGLVLGDPEHDGHLVNYLDMAIWFENSSQQWHSKLYDKKIELVAKGLKLNKFPDPASKLSTRCKYGVITSQLHRYNVACTRRCHFLTPARSLYKTYLKKGYSQPKVNQYFSRFMRRHVPHYQPGQVLRMWRKQPGTVCQ